MEISKTCMSCMARRSGLNQFIKYRKSLVDTNTLRPAWQLSLSTPPPALSSTHHFVSIKLSTSNILYWLTHMFSFLHGQILFGYVDGFSVPPPRFLFTATGTPYASNPNFIHRKKQDQMVLSMLIFVLSNEVLPLTLGCTMARDLWTEIKQACVSSTCVRILSLITHL